MKSAHILLLCGFFVACQTAPKDFIRQKEGFRHQASDTFYPKRVGSYGLLDNDPQLALQSKKEISRATYVDYGAGGVMTSILFRPFAKVEAFRKTKSLKELVAEDLKPGRSKVIGRVQSKTKSGKNFLEVRLKTEEDFLTHNFSGVTFSNPLPAVTKLIYLEHDHHVVKIKTAYPVQDAEELAKPNDVFVLNFLEAQ